MIGMALASKHRFIAATAVGAALIGLAVWWAMSIWSDHALLRANPDVLVQDRDLMASALMTGASVYRAACQDCHGAQAKGDPVQGTPNLTDDDWLYGGGTPSEIEHTIAYGIRSGHAKAWNLAIMPSP